MAETRVTHVSLSGKSRWQTNVRIGEHEFITDVSPDTGGQDAGPDPEELLLAAWGSCTAMTVQMYAQRKGWPLENIEVDLHRHPRTTSAPERLVRSIKLSGPLDEEQRKRLKEIAEKCPVHKTLTHTPQIETDLV